ncbi:MAG: hypothetical protein H0U90_01280 [Actinobacteria bacterium]|nr:hypothetical protein [Actinomycetota bacterium]
MRRPDEVVDGAAEALAAGLARGHTRRSFLGRVGVTLLAVMGGSAVAAAVRPDEAESFHFCGHIWTTGSCPNPYSLPRIDRRGFPLRPRDGRPIDNLGRLVDAEGYPADETGARLAGPDGELLERGPRTRLCEDWVPEQFRIDAVTQGSWYRCCSGQVRKLVDCCSTSTKRVNGDKALRGYCYTGRRVFCVMYYDTGLPC